MSACAAPGCALPKTPGRGARYCERHRTQAAERQRLNAIARTARWRKENPDKYVDGMRAHYEKTAEQQRARARAWHHANPERVRLQRERTKAKRYPRVGKYGLSLADYTALLASQGGACAICGRTENGKRHNFDVDHDHETGEIRGLLCNRCNRLLSNARDRTDLLHAAARYLERSRSMEEVA